MYEDTYTEFSPADFKYGGYKVHKISNDLPEAEWDFGDSVTLSFDFTNQLMDKQMFFLGCDFVKIEFNIYNFRGTKMDVEYVPENESIYGNTFNFKIDNESSLKLIPGLYHCEAILKKINEIQDEQTGEIEEKVVEQLTLMNKEDCLLRVR